MASIQKQFEAFSNEMQNHTKDHGFVTFAADNNIVPWSCDKRSVLLHLFLVVEESQKHLWLSTQVELQILIP